MFCVSQLCYVVKKFKVFQHSPNKVIKWKKLFIFATWRTNENKHELKIREEKRNQTDDEKKKWRIGWR